MCAPGFEMCARNMECGPMRQGRLLDMESLRLAIGQTVGYELSAPSKREAIECVMSVPNDKPGH